MKYRRLLFNTPDPFDIFNTEELFVKAVKENCQYHYDNCPEYKKILHSMNFRPDFINSYDDIQKIPFLPTLFFKNHNIYSVPPYLEIVGRIGLKDIKTCAAGAEELMKEVKL